MKPIPLSILKQSCTHEIVTKDNWGVETKVSYDISNVYFEISDKIIKTQENTEIIANVLMCFDIVNSVVKLSDVETTLNVSQDDIIIFNSTQYRIVKIDKIYQANTTDIHHYEIYLR